MTAINFNHILSKTSTIPDNIIIDNPERLKIHQSLWKKLTNYKTKNHLDNNLLEKVCSFFEERYGFHDHSAFQRIWDKLGAKIWTPNTHLTTGIIRDIDKNFRKNLIYHGEGIRRPENLPECDKAVQNLVQALLHGGDFPSNLVKKRTAKAIFVSLDKEFMKHFLQQLQAELTNLSKNLPKNKEEEVVWRAFLGNVIALLPYCYPASGEIVQIPHLENGNCRLINYKIEIIPLSYSDLASPMIALGMTPKDDLKASPVLAFSGTTFPAGHGFATTVLADFTPGNSVGEAVYERNKVKIASWLADKEHVHVVGTSLGGALTLHALRHNHHIDRVDVYNPPGLYKENWKKGTGATCDVNIYNQPGDVVSRMGAWPTGKNVSLYTVFQHQGIAENGLSSHARAFTGCDKISIIKEDPKEENLSFSRRFLTKLHQCLGPFIIFLPVLCALLVYKLACNINQFSLYYFEKMRHSFYSPNN